MSGQDSAVIPKESYEESQLGEEMEAVMIEDLLLPPGRFGRPEKILIILRGVPASGKSHLARLIKVLFLVYFYDSNANLKTFRKKKLLWAARLQEYYPSTIIT